MSACDVPIVGGLTGEARARATSRPGVRRFTTSMFILVIFTSVMTWSFAFRNPYRHHMSVMIVIPLSLISVALLGFLIRRAVVEVGYFGVRWGWPWMRFRMAVGDITVARVYATGIAFMRPAGTFWYLAASDWNLFDSLATNLEVARVPVERIAGPAPLRARMQGYGRALDILMILAAVGSLLMLSMAAR